MVLIPKKNRVRLSSSFFLHWVAASINDLLPTARVGGDIVLARVASMWGTPLRIATAAMIVDITIGVVTNVIFVVTACILLVAATGRTDLARPALVAVLTGPWQPPGSTRRSGWAFSGGVPPWLLAWLKRLAPIRSCTVAKPLMGRFGFFTPDGAEWRGVTFSGSCRGSLLSGRGVDCALGAWLAVKFFYSLSLAVPTIARDSQYCPTAAGRSSEYLGPGCQHQTNRQFGKGSDETPLFIWLARVC